MGEFALLQDHVMISGRNPLFGHNEDKWGTRFPDVGEAYSKDVQKTIQSAAAVLLYLVFNELIILTIFSSICEGFAIEFAWSFVRACGWTSFGFIC